MKNSLVNFLKPSRIALLLLPALFLGCNGSDSSSSAQVKPQSQTASTKENSSNPDTSTRISSDLTPAQPLCIGPILPESPLDSVQAADSLSMKAFSIDESSTPIRTIVSDSGNYFANILDDSIKIYYVNTRSQASVKSVAQISTNGKIVNSLKFDSDNLVIAQVGDEVWGYDFALGKLVFSVISPSKLIFADITGQMLAAETSDGKHYSQTIDRNTIGQSLDLKSGISTSRTSNYGTYSMASYPDGKHTDEFAGVALSQDGKQYGGNIFWGWTLGGFSHQVQFEIESSYAITNSYNIVFNNGPNLGDGPRCDGKYKNYDFYGTGQNPEKIIDAHYLNGNDLLVETDKHEGVYSTQICDFSLWLDRDSKKIGCNRNNCSIVSSDRSSGIFYVKINRLPLKNNGLSDSDAYKSPELNLYCNKQFSVAAIDSSGKLISDWAGLKNKNIQANYFGPNYVAFLGTDGEIQLFTSDLKKKIVQSHMTLQNRLADGSNGDLSYSLTDRLNIGELNYSLNPQASYSLEDSSKFLLLATYPTAKSSVQGGKTTYRTEIYKPAKH